MVVWKQGNRKHTGPIAIEEVLAGVLVDQVSELGDSLCLCSNTIGRVLVVVDSINGNTMTGHQGRIFAKNRGDQEADGQPDGHARNTGH